MKQYLKILLCAFAGMSLMACQNDDSGDVVEEGYFLIPVGTLADGGQISGIKLYCIEYDSSKRGDYYSHSYEEKIKTVKDYSEFYFWLNITEDDLELDSWIKNNTTLDERNDILNLGGAYWLEKTSFMIEAFRSNKELDHRLWPVFFTAYVNGEVSITCDKTLYGEAPGTNLSQYFEVTPTSNYIDCLPVGIENPRLLYSFGEKLPTAMDQYFVNEAWFLRSYVLRLKDVPSEKHDNLTLRLSFPMTIEHIWDYFVAPYKGVEYPDRFTEEVFTAECRINFDWD